MSCAPHAGGWVPQLYLPRRTGSILVSARTPRLLQGLSGLERLKPLNLESIAMLVTSSGQENSSTLQG